MKEEARLCRLQHSRTLVWLRLRLIQLTGNRKKVPVYKKPTFSIDGIPGIIQYKILNNKRHVLTKDNDGFVKLREITRGLVIKNYGQVSFEKKKEELFEMVLEKDESICHLQQSLQNFKYVFSKHIWKKLIIY